jgi:MerR family mercuric resistance operon transcriptional regulator
MMAMPNTNARGFSIGGLSGQTGVNIETIRYYERVGLLPVPPRTGGGHRLYGDGHARRLTFIRRSRELGFSLEDIRKLLALVDGGDYTCADVKVIATRHLADIHDKIADLARLEQVLKGIAARCDGGALPDCPIIEALSAG